MAVYAIGDVQGCYGNLCRLLDKINFDPAADRLWFTGDLVNRGPRSLAALRLVAGLGDRAVTVLGNHDLHLLAIAAGAARASWQDTLQEILVSKDSDDLLTWLSRRPLFHWDESIGYGLVHAGLLPQWDLQQAQDYAREAEVAIAGSRATEFFQVMYGDTPNRWCEDLSGWERLRLIVNVFTRLRFCSPDGGVDFHHKGAPGSQPAPLLPWFQIPGRRTSDVRVVFGHWSTLGRFAGHNVIGTDSGCCWGGELTAVRLDCAVPTFEYVDCRSQPVIER